MIDRLDLSVTQTESDAAGKAKPKAPRPTLSIVAHPDPRYIGTRRPLARGEHLPIGRGGEAFGPGALDDKRLSRRHAEVTLTAVGLTVADRKSRNGTWVNGERIQSASLQTGDVVRVGRILLLLHLAPPAYEAPRHATIVGRSHALQLVLEQAATVGPRDTHVLIAGESGAGKELVAREIHDLSGRSGAFVAVNCAAISDGVLASELFGHVRGAFTGAHRDRKGVVAEAHGGTLFLDEIGDATPAMQASLLRLLQNAEYRPVGASRPLSADVRVVAATHRDLSAMVEAGSFRQDLFTRVARWVIRVPPLRDRLEDVPLLAAAFAERYLGHRVVLAPELVEGLLRRPWTGNIRELDAVIERVTVETPTDAVILQATAWLEAEVSAAAESTNSGKIAPTPLPKPRPRRGRRKLSVSELIRVVGDHDGNMNAVARSLGVGRSTLYRWLDAAEVDLDEVRRSHTTGEQAAQPEEPEA